ncbi:MAG TPA: peptidase M23 [Rhodobacteraceae bacterium]|jgi:murein DD-endopeptidase MepM/ murein hydrolase activator NlpD|nr:peptidase M23 [Paracoccaceae bacterium]
MGGKVWNKGKLRASVLTNKITQTINAVLGKKFPERRVFLRSDTETKFLRLTPSTQLLGWIGSIAIFSWAIIATAILLMDNIGSGNVREQVKREQIAYETRLNSLSVERDIRAKEAEMAHNRFSIALAQVSEMQSALLTSEDRRAELEKGIDVIQSTLRRTMLERDKSRAKNTELSLSLNGTPSEVQTAKAQADDAIATVDFLTAALDSTASERDQIALDAVETFDYARELEFQAQLTAERNDRIFTQLEDAMTISVKPLDKMFRAAGLSSKSLIEKVRRTHSGQGGPLAPLSFSTMGTKPDADTMRANRILNDLDRLNLYRIAAQKAPFALPLKGAFRFTSPFGYRWGRLHAGTDFAAAHGTPIYSTADGVVYSAGWGNGYGKLVKIQHAFGIETRYAHMSKILVKAGQRVSRGQQIGAMGNTGRSTGTHLHYEVRVGGKPVNPMTYIKAARDVF